jgi:hypothetical protein
VVANAGGTTATVLLNEPGSNPIGGAPSNGSFTISPEPSLYGQSVTLGIAMSAASGPVPGGNVSFNVDGSFIASKSLANGVATYNFPNTLITGTHTFVASYEGDATYAAENFTFLHTVLPPVYATTTVLVAQPSTLLTSQTTRLTATVSSVVSVPAGTVTFLDGTNSLGSRSIYNGAVLTFDTNLLSAGVHALTAVYHGYQQPFDQQAVFQPSTSAAVTVTVNATATSTAISSSTESATSGTVVTLTANVTSNAAVPFGGATFYDGAAALGTCSIKADGSCTFSTASLAVGAHNITAAFNANATFGGSTSAATIVTITAAAGLAPTVLRLSATTQGNRTLLNAGASAPDGTPSGDIVYLDSGTVLGTARQDGPSGATLAAPILGPGMHTLYASFSGASGFAPASSPALVEQIPPSGDTFFLRLSEDSIDMSQSQTLQLMISPESGFQDGVQLSCVDGVPADYACVFSPASLFGGSSTLRLQRRSSVANGQTAPLLFAPIAGIALLFLRKNARRRGRRSIVIAMSLIAIVAACGNPSTPPPQLSILTIRASAGLGSAAVIHSAQIVVKVR